jgi:hypothetical protein
MNHNDKTTRLSSRMRSILKLSALVLTPIVLGMAACTKMDATYHDFWKNGEIFYPGSPDSIHVYSGKERIAINWILLGDPSAKKATIYWNNETDSIEVPIQRGAKNTADTMQVILDLPEGTYSFDIYTYDDHGNRSVVANAIGHSYGGTYINSLLSRLIKGASFANDTVMVLWGDPADETSVGSELRYEDTTGVSRQLFVSPFADSTVLTDFAYKPGASISYRTLYVPDSTTIDTFYTAYHTAKVLGPRTLLSKTGWTVTASSYDQRNAARAPESAIDENISTIWVNQIVPATDFPHTITVDMGSIQQDIYGVSMYLTSRNEEPRLVDIYISDNGTDWKLMGLFTMEHKTSRQYINFQTSENLRYFRATIEQPFGNTKNVVIPEIGVFTR